ncbi:MAG: SDR family NAD(P)-dependent oxidoreductase [Chloroflexi bacterium]|nr:MAG: SDR family NAD(P)-dependent oxidoreductase [Chloroflexota bacterium]
MTRRISLPTYPFARERYWLPTISLSGRMGEHLHALIAGHATLHPLVQHNTSTLWEQRFSSTFYGDEFFLADHQVLGQHIMPAVAYLEMARAAVQEALGDTATRERLSMDLTDIVWAHPLVVEEQPVTVHITLSPQDTTTIAFIISADAPGEEENAELVYSQGRVVLHAPRSSIPNVDLAAVQARCQHATLSGPECYQRIRSLSINYGPAFQGIEQVMVGEEEVLARFRLPKMVSQTHVENGYSKSASKSLPAYMLHPSLLDATLQACIGLQVVPVVGQEAQSSAPVVPFALSALEIVGTLPAQGWAWVRRRPDGTASKVFDIEMCDDEGKVAVRLRGLSTRVLIGEEETQTRLLIPCWKEETIPILPHSEEVDTPIESLVLLYELPDSLTSYIQSQIASEGHGQGLKVHKWHCKQFRREQCFQNAVIQLIQELQHLVQSRPEGQLLVQVVIGSTEEPSFLEALTGVLQTAQQEYPQLRAQLIEIQGKPEEETLLALLRENQHRPYKPYIRYQDGKRWVREWQVVHTGEEGYASDDGDIVQREYVPWKEGGCYLITGGAGGLARLFVQEIASYVETATVILVGRSVLSQELHAHLGRVGRAGLHIDYQQVDVGDGPAVHALIQKVLAQHGHLDGIIHAAGVLRDSLLLNKTPEDVHEVLVPKVIGVELLDEASDALSLDFFILCSSLSAVVGNVGQADYAAANAYLNAFAHQRQAHVLAGKRQGQTLSINWPLWETGGMQIETETRQLMQKRMGIEAMGTQVGMRTLYQALACGQAQVIVLHGQVERIKQRLLHQSAASPMQAIQKVTEEEQQTAAPIGQEVLRERAYTYFKKQLAAVIKLPVQQIDVKAPLEDYGFDSVLALRWISALEDAFGPLSKTLLFEHPTVHSVTEYFLRSYPEQLQGVLRIENDGQYRSNTEKMPPKRVGTGLTPVRVSPKEDDARRVWRTGVNPVPTRFSSTGTDRHARQDKEAQAGDIAIIGVAGRYPGARDLDAFWENLCTGRDCITEIPPERWDYRLYFSSDKNKPGTTYSKWGGFLDGVDEFDPLFFNISPQEAERMDPQERLFLECVYATLEDAGYTRETLSRYQGKGLTGNVGVFVGVMYEEYQLFGAEAQIQGQPTTLAGSPSSIANRVSYFCNFHGPSIAVDTMCSSSLTAIYLACQSIKQGTCGLAIAGGVNVSIHPNKYLGLSQGKFVSSQGTCRSFGLGADGYVPAEGVGAVLLKPLLQAEADGDHIYGVIKASAINHGGKTNGYTVPNPQAQAEVIEQALKDARIDPRTITYIEAHGTGTVLGDPIEIAGLTRAFEQRMQDNAGEKMGGELASPPSSPTSLSGWCAIGSVKSNIGHAESAAGIAGITKVLLQMRYGHLVPSLHAEMLNPHIDFSATPFVVQRELSAWKRPQALVAGEEEEVPRRAGISAFGAGGSNAHVILEEYVERHQRSHQTGLNGELKTNPLLIVLSARTEGQLHKRAQQLLVWCSLWACPIDTKEPVEQAQDWHKAQSLHNLAYTLQVGREALEERLAFQVSSLTELKERLRRYIEGCTEGGDWYRGRVKQNDPIGAFAADEDGQKTVAAWISKGKYEKLLEWWVKGLAVNWKLLYTVEAGGASILPRRIALPTYPFARERYWFPTMARNATMSGASSQASPWDRVSSYTIQHPLPDSFDLPRTLLLTPGWKEETISRQSLAEEALPSTDNHLLVLLCDLPGIEASRLQAKLPQGGRCRSLQSLQPRREQRFQDMIAQMIRELQDLRQSRPVGLVLIQVVVAHRAEPSLLEALVGVLKVAQQEYPKLQGQLIEVDGEPKEGELLTWLRENQFLLPHEFHIRYQDGQRWVREWRELDHAPVGAHPIDVKFAPLREHVPWKNGGCYLITGGAGGLARLFVEEIVRHVQEATIVLVGRSAQSEELRTYLKQVGRAGISIDYQQVDVGVVPCADPVTQGTDGSAVHALIQRVMQKPGRLNGIIHAAGVLHDSLLLNKTPEEVRAVLAPKVMGVEHLDEASRDIPLDFFLLCSSLSAVAGNVGQADYAGANAYLDAFAYARQTLVLAGERQGATLSINWPLWKEGGMQIEAEARQMIQERLGIEVMETETGMRTPWASGTDQTAIAAPIPRFPR